MHVALVGIPGAGKSTVARLAGALCGRPVVDFDLEIERLEGRSVADIFSDRGEDYFRSLEACVTAGQVNAEPAILAPGGGWITRPDTVALLRPPARLVWLRVSPATALERMGGNRTARPLLMKADPEAELARLAEVRAGAYATADASINTEAIVLQEVALQVAQLASFWGRQVG